MMHASRLDAGKELNVAAVLIKLDSEGCSFFSRQEGRLYPPAARVYDVTGAGTWSCHDGLCQASKLSWEEACRWHNLAAGLRWKNGRGP